MSRVESKILLMEQYVGWSNESQNPDHEWTREYLDRGLSLCKQLEHEVSGVMKDEIKSRQTQLFRMRFGSKAG